MAYVYRHIRLDNNEPFYIGISKRDSPNYERAYSSHNKQRSSHWINIFNKTPIRVEILLEGISYDEAKEKEMEFVSLYGRRVDGGTLVNLTRGGDGVLGVKNPKLAERNKTGIWRGRTHTEETKRIMSQKSIGRKFTETHIENIKLAMRRRNYVSIRNPKWKGYFYVYSSKDGSLVGKYDSMTEAARDLKLHVGNISTRLLHNRDGIYPQYDFVRVKE